MALAGGRSFISSRPAPDLGGRQDACYVIACFVCIAVGVALLVTQDPRAARHLAAGQRLAHADQGHARHFAATFKYLGAAVAPVISEKRSAR